MMELLWENNSRFLVVISFAKKLYRNAANFIVKFEYGSHAIF